MGWAPPDSGDSGDSGVSAVKLYALPETGCLWTSAGNPYNIVQTPVAMIGLPTLSRSGADRDRGWHELARKGIDSTWQRDTT